MPDTWSDTITRRKPQSPLQITFTRPPATLRVAGVIDESTYALLNRALAKAALAGDQSLCVDLADVGFCDLAGLRTIISAAAPSNPSRTALRQVTIANLPDHLTALMQILGWDATPGLVLAQSGSQA